MTEASPFPLPPRPLLPRLIAGNNRGRPGSQPGGSKDGIINRDGAWRSHLPSRVRRPPLPPAELRSAAVRPSPPLPPPPGGPIASPASPALPPTQRLFGPVLGPAEEGGGLPKSEEGSCQDLELGREGTLRVLLASRFPKEETKNGGWGSVRRLIHPVTG